jgi:hypothetical protein
LENKGRFAVLPSYSFFDLAADRLWFFFFS